MLDISPDSDPWLNLKIAMLFSSAEIDREKIEQCKKIFEIRQRSSNYVETQAAIRSRPRASIGAKSARLSQSEGEAHIIKQRRESVLFDVLSLVATINNLPDTSYINEITNRTTEGVLAGSMLLYIHTLNSNTFKTASGRIAKGSENIAAYISEKHNLGRLRKSRGRQGTDYEKTYPTINEILAKKAWKKFQPVCHLWAAYIHIIGFKSDLSTVSLTDEVDWKSVLILAKQYEAVAAKFFATRTIEEKHLTLLSVVDLGFSDLDSEPPKLSISIIPDSIVKQVHASVGTYDTKHK